MDSSLLTQWIELMEFLKKLGKTKLIVLALASLLMVVAITALVINLSKPPMVPIYNKLSPDDSTAVITKLQNLSKVFFHILCYDSPILF